MTTFQDGPDHLSLFFFSVPGGSLPSGMWGSCAGMFSGLVEVMKDLRCFRLGEGELEPLSYRVNNTQ